MDKVFKAFKGIIKSIDEKNFTVDVIVSTESIDRDSEKINLDAFKKRLKVYKAHPVLLSSHSYSDLTKQIGVAVSIKVTKEGLLAKFKYFVGEGNPEADWGWNLASKGVAGYSIGFMAHGFEDNDIETAKKTGLWRTYTDVELLEISQVLIPSNRDAVQGRMADAEGVEKEMCELAIKSVFKDETIINNSSVSEDRIKSVEDQIARCAKELADGSGKVLDDEVLKMFTETDVFKSAVKEIIAEQKHYSKELFNKKDVDGGDKPTKNPSSNDYENAVLAGLKHIR